MLRNCLVILLCTVVSLQHGHAQTDLVDSLQKVLDNYFYRDTTRINTLTTLAQYSWGSNPELTRQSAEEALAISQELNYPKGIADAHREISRYYWSQTDYSQAIDYAMKAVDQYAALRDDKGVSHCLGTIGICYAQANNYERSIHYQQKALDLNNKIHNKQGIARNLNNLGYVSELQKDFKKALHYYQQALDMRNEIGVEADIVMPLGNVGSAYMALGDLPLAQEYFEKALTLAIKVGNKNMEALQHQSIGEALFKRGRSQDARFHFNKSLEIAAMIGDKKRQEGTYELLRNLEEMNKNYEAAFQYQLLLQNLRDTLYSQERTRKLAEMESRLERERKEQAIHLLEREQRIQSLWNTILLCGIVVLGFGFMLFYFLQRYRHRKKQEVFSLKIDLLTEQQKKLTEQFQDAIRPPDATLQESLDNRLLRTAIDVVENHISDPMFGVEKMAEEMGMSRANLHRKLKLVSGFSPGDFIRNVRLKRAAQLLKQQTDLVSQVGFTVGFEDQSYFSKCFKKQFGMSPSEFSRSGAQISTNLNTNLPVIDT